MKNLFSKSGTFSNYIPGKILKDTEFFFRIPYLSIFMKALILKTSISLIKDILY